MCSVQSCNAVTRASCSEANVCCEEKTTTLPEPETAAPKSGNIQGCRDMPVLLSMSLAQSFYCVAETSRVAWVSQPRLETSEAHRCSKRFMSKLSGIPFASARVWAMAAAPAAHPSGVRVFRTFSKPTSPCFSSDLNSQNRLCPQGPAKLETRWSLARASAPADWKQQAAIAAMMHTRYHIT